MTLSLFLYGYEMSVIALDNVSTVKEPITTFSPLSPQGTENLFARHPLNISGIYHRDVDLAQSRISSYYVYSPEKVQVILIGKNNSKQQGESKHPKALKRHCTLSAHILRLDLILLQSKQALPLTKVQFLPENVILEELNAVDHNEVYGYRRPELLQRTHFVEVGSGPTVELRISQGKV
ncbi:hypothetical protein STEG23_010788 [Scotinomys teguina]